MASLVVIAVREYTVIDECTELASTDKLPWLVSWPENDLDRAYSCPVCGKKRRELLYKNLKDNIFFVAPGLWSMYRCIDCKSAYLDPRPSIKSIGQAYANYYTHTSERFNQPNINQLSLVGRMRRVMANGYLNARFGTTRYPATKIGMYFLYLFPANRQILDSEFRFLPKPIRGQRLLDIGSGNGAFLATAASAGWTVTGLDFDPRAVETSRQQGFDARTGSIDLFLTESDCFDAVSLSHVIEHVHDPLALLKDIKRLLKPDGTLYIETPNINSLGATIYQGSWRGIETPRHLVLFNHRSLRDALERVGFEVRRSVRRKSVAKGMLLQSANIQAGNKPLDSKTKLRWTDRMNLVFSYLFKSRDEFITIIARKRHEH